MSLRLRDGYDIENCDYVLEDDSDRAWITINNISVYIVRQDDGVSVELYPLNHEDGDCITETWATWGEAERTSK